MLSNVPYASLENLINRGIGSNADEVCKNLIGKVDEIDLGEAPHGEPTIWYRIRITGARLRHHPDSMHPEYIHVDGEEL